MVNSLECNFGPESLPPFLESFDIANPSVVMRKLEHMREDAIAPEFWADFDHTISQPGMSVWKAASRILSQELEAESKLDRDVHLDLERRGELTALLHQGWSLRELQRHIANGSTEQALQELASGIDLRPFALEIFKHCKSSGVPCHIHSAGIANVIRHVGLPGAFVHANEFLVEGGAVTGWNEKAFVHGSNKSEMARLALDAAGVRGGLARKIILGDSLTDAAMLPRGFARGDRALRIRTHESGPGSQAGINSLEYQTESYEGISAAEKASRGTGETHSLRRPGFDMILRTDDLEPILMLLQWVRP